MILTLALTIAGVTYFNYRSFEELDESVEGHQKSLRDMAVHQIFLVVRFACVGLNIMLCFTLVAFLSFIFYEKCFDKADVPEPLPSMQKHKSVKNTL